MGILGCPRSAGSDPIDMTQDVEITPRKRPTQPRAQATFDALVEACAQLLAEVGYDAVTTNAIADRAGVSIGSLYEYFPSKDAVVAQVAELVTRRVMERLQRQLDALLAQPTSDGIQRWVSCMYQTLSAERALVRVFTQQVPFRHLLESSLDLPTKLLEFSERARAAAGIHLERPAASLLLINNLVGSTLLQLVVEPHSGVSEEDILESLSAQVRAVLSPAAK